MFLAFMPFGGGRDPYKREEVRQWLEDEETAERLRGHHDRRLPLAATAVLALGVILLVLIVRLLA